MPSDAPGVGTDPVRVALAPDAPLVMAGITAILSADDRPFVVVDLPEAASGDGDVDVLLYDPVIGLPDGARPRPGRLRPRLVALSWALDRDAVTRARNEGATALLSKDLDGPQLAELVQAVHDGTPIEFVVRAGSHLGQDDASAQARPGGLTQREVDVLELICGGRSNQEIAETLFLSINSVKTYIRSAYRRIGVTRRSQAVLWGMHAGLVTSPPEVR